MDKQAINNSYQELLNLIEEGYAMSLKSLKEMNKTGGDPHGSNHTKEDAYSHLWAILAIRSLANCHSPFEAAASFSSKEAIKEASKEFTVDILDNPSLGDAMADAYQQKYYDLVCLAAEVMEADAAQQGKKTSAVGETAMGSAFKKAFQRH